MGPMLGSMLIGGGAIASSLADTVSNYLVNQQNLDFQKKNLSYQKDIQRKIFSREDNAIQRRVADLKAAGLSPTLAAGSAAKAGQAISTTAPKSEFKLNSSQKMAMALNMLKMKADISKTEASAELDKAQALKTRNQTEIGGETLKQQKIKTEIDEKLKNVRMMSESHKKDILAEQKRELEALRRGRSMASGDEIPSHTGSSDAYHKALAEINIQEKERKISKLDAEILKTDQQIKMLKMQRFLAPINTASSVVKTGISALGGK